MRTSSSSIGVGPSVALHLGLIDDTSGLAAAVRAASRGRLDPVDLAGLAVAVPSGPRVLVGLPSADRWAELRPASVDALLQCARATVPVTVVDIGFGVEGGDLDWADPGAPARYGAARASLAAADVVVSVGRPDAVGLVRLIHGALPPGKDLAAHPVLVAGWFGTLVTMLNLLPVGQLDGGHLTHAWFGEGAVKVGRVVAGALLPLALFGSVSWLVWFFLVTRVVGFGHPPVVVTEEPLSRGRKWVCAVCFIATALTFMPVPLDGG